MATFLFPPSSIRSRVRHRSAVLPPRPSHPEKPAASGAADSPDVLDLSPQVDLPQGVVRQDKVRLARQRLASGAYDEPAVLDAAIAKMLRELG